MILLTESTIPLRLSLKDFAGFWFLVAEKSSQASHRAERERVTCVDFRIVIYAVPAKSMLEVEHLRQAVQFI